MKPARHNSIARQIKIFNAKFTSVYGREVGLFIVFLCIATGFWMMLTLNNDTQEVVEIEFSITDIPDSVTILSDIPHSVKVNIHDKGVSLLRSHISGNKTIKANWLEYAISENTFKMSKVDILNRLRSTFSPSAQIINVIPDSIRLYYTTNPGKKVPVKVETILTPEIGFTVNGPIVMTPDSVMLYSIDDLPMDITHVTAAPIQRVGLRDTTHISMHLTTPPGVKIIPEYVTLTIPVEPLIMKQQTVNITAINVPYGEGLLTFPASVDVSYLIPMSAYKNDGHSLEVVVDYSDAVASTSGMIPVKTHYIPSIYRNVSITPDSVEYILETKH